MSDQIIFETKNFTSDKENHFMKIKDSVLQKDVRVLQLQYQDQFDKISMRRDQNNTIYKLALIKSTKHRTDELHIFQSTKYGVVLKIGHMLGYKENLNFKRTEILQATDHSAIKLKFNNMDKYEIY